MRNLRNSCREKKNSQEYIIIVLQEDYGGKRERMEMMVE